MDPFKEPLIPPSGKALKLFKKVLKTFKTTELGSVSELENLMEIRRP